MHLERRYMYMYFEKVNIAFLKLYNIWTFLEHLHIKSLHIHVQYLQLHTRSPVAQSVECPLREFDTGLRHTKVFKNGTSCSSLRKIVESDVKPEQTNKQQHKRCAHYTGHSRHTNHTLRFDPHVWSSSGLRDREIVGLNPCWDIYTT